MKKTVCLEKPVWGSGWVRALEYLSAGVGRAAGVLGEFAGNRVEMRGMTPVLGGIGAEVGVEWLEWPVACAGVDGGGEGRLRVLIEEKGAVGMRSALESEYGRGWGQAGRARRIRVLGVPLDLGASRRGVDMGPSAVRVAGLAGRLESLGHAVTDGGNVAVEIAETRDVGSVQARFLREIAETCGRTAEAVREALEAGMTPLVLGGDHSVAAGTVSGVAEYYRRRGEGVGLIWLDAHSDINTPASSLSGNVHGMPLAALLGLGQEGELAALGGIFGVVGKVRAENVALVGVRDIDAAERENLRLAGVRAVYTMREIDERGMRAVMEEAVRVAGEGTAGYHVSLDMDFVDPEDAPGVGTPVRGGATYREAHLAMEIVADDARMVSFEMVEVNPVIDERNRTADLGVELACSAFGKKIL